MPTLGDGLHWLPVSQRITTCKLCTIIYKCLHQSPLEYLQELCMPVMNSASHLYLRSAAHGDLQIIATRTVTYGPHRFAVLDLKPWNSLLTTLRQSTLTLTQFCSRIKTQLFGLAYRSALRLFRLLERVVQILYTYIQFVLL